MATSRIWDYKFIDVIISLKNIMSRKKTMEIDVTPR